MFAVKNENELSKLGLKVHPGDPTQAVPLNQPTDAIPDESWSLDQLAQFACNGLAESKRLTAEATCLARKSTVQVFWAGCALRIAKPKVKSEGKNWGDWLEERAIPRTNAWEATELHRLAKKVEAVADLGLTEAKEKFGITKPPKKRASESKEQAASAKRASGKKPATPKEPRNPEWPVISDDKPNPNTPPPPAKENPNSPLAVLVKVRGRLEYLRDDLSNIDWKSESPEDYRRELQEITSLVERIAKEVPNNG
jgi:hypothetical protein